MIVSQMSFFAKISDPLIGATYMTLLNTISNLGYVWIKTFFLWFVDIITWKSCMPKREGEFTNSTLMFTSNKCINSVDKIKCSDNGGTCGTIIDGFFIEVLFGVIFAIAWFCFSRKLIKNLQSLPIRNWHILKQRLKNTEMTLLEKVDNV